MFASFFSMVRVKIACKDVSKNRGKRLYEMQNNLYLIVFKVEKKAGLLVGDGGEEDDNDDPGDQDEDDNGMEEIDQDMELERKAPSGGGKATRGDPG
jgi:hypothetical protein